MNRSIPAFLFAAFAMAGLPAAAQAQVQAQDGSGAAPKTETAGKPAADTHEPGKTATDAVTNPSGKPPTAETPPKSDR